MTKYYPQNITPFACAFSEDIARFVTCYLSKIPNVVGNAKTPVGLFWYTLTVMDLE